MPRADAARNRALLLDAAAAELSEHGLDVSIARIAARAGVAKGTVFNHFPTKEDLVAAILADQLGVLATTAEALLDHADPQAALLEFMTAGADLQADDPAYCAAATAITRTHPAVRTASARLARAAEALTARARQSGAIRADVTGHDVMLLLSAPTAIAAPVAAARPELRRRYLHLIFDGLRTEAAHELPVAAPTDQDFVAAATAAL